MNILMPQLGETVTEGTIITWCKREGDTVQADDVLLEIETDKAATEVPAPMAGVLSRILVPAGQTVAVGTTLAVLDSADASATPLTQSMATTTAPEREEVAAVPAGAACLAKDRGLVPLHSPIRRAAALRHATFRA